MILHEVMGVPLKNTLAGFTDVINAVLTMMHVRPIYTASHFTPNRFPSQILDVF